MANGDEVDLDCSKEGGECRIDIGWGEILTIENRQKANKTEEEAEKPIQD